MFSLVILKNDDKIKYTEISLPNSAVLLNKLIMRKETLEAMGNPETLSLIELLKNKNLKGMLLAKRFYGASIDSILEEYESTANIERLATNDVMNLAKVLEGRDDYIIE